MFKLKFNRVTKLLLIAFCFMGLFSASAQAEEVLPPRGYHLGSFEESPIKVPKPKMLFRHLLYNFQNQGFHNPATFVDTAADQILALKFTQAQFKSDAEKQATLKQAKSQLIPKLSAYYENKGPDGATPAQKFSTLYRKLYEGFNMAFAKMVRQPIPIYVDGKLVKYVVPGQKDLPAGTPVALATDVFTTSQRLFRMMLLISRGFNNDFFAELRKNDPTFMIPGDLDPKASTEDKNKLVEQKEKGLGIRVERATYLVTRFKDIAYGYAYNLKDPAKSGYGDNWAPVDVERQSPAYTNVIYSRPVAYFGNQMSRFAGAMLNLMDYTVSGYFKYIVENITGKSTWPVDPNGVFMLGTKNDQSNAEKAYLHKITNRIQKMNAEAGELADREASQEKVREVVAWYVKEAMKNKASDSQVDFARDISRQAALGMVSDYFGFYPPDVNSQTQWSRNTQNSFFHNIFDFPWYDHQAFKAGEEMAAYISQAFAPSYDEQLANGRPATDTVSMMINGHAKIPSAIKAAFSINDGRIMTNTMGLLVGAGETTTMAVNFALHEIMVRSLKDKSLWQDFVSSAKAAAAGDKKARERFDAYIWEALRFKPVNPWTERMSDKTETFETCTEPHKVFVGGAYQDVESKCKDVTVADKSRVLFVTQSAMFDPDMELIGGSKDKDPWEFSVRRGNDNYIHFAFGYHRCLGDDVAQAMTPEIALQLVANVNNIDITASLASVDNPQNELNPVDRELMFSKQTVAIEPSFIAYLKSKGVNFPNTLVGESTPFPETFTIVYSSKSDEVTRDISPLSKVLGYLENELGKNPNYSNEIEAGLAYVAYTEATNDKGASDRVLNNGQNRFNIDMFMNHQENLLSLEEKLRNIIGDDYSNCMKWQTDDYGDATTRSEVCKNTEAFKRFNTCYMIQRSLGLLSSKHAFNKCAYEKDAMGTYRFSGTDKFEDAKENLNKYLDIVNGKGDFYWVKYHRSASN